MIRKTGKTRPKAEKWKNRRQDAGGRGDVAANLATTFTEETADATGQTERTIRRDGASLSPRRQRQLSLRALRAPGPP
jgi:hypothetical protein